MKKFSLILLLSLAMPLLAVVPGSAAGQPADPAPGSNFDQRLQQRKKEQNIQLDEKSQKQLISQCRNTQAVIRQLQVTTGPMISNRNTVYRQIDGKIWIATGQLKLASADTFKLEKQQLDYSSKIVGFQSTAANYQQTLDDTVVIDCKTDVTGFMALVSTARAYYATLRSQSDGIRDYLVNTVNPTLTDHMTQLQPKPGSNGGQ